MWIVPKNHPLFYLFAPVTEESKEVLSEQLELSPQSLMWRSKPSPLRTWLQRWKRAKWFRLLSGRILRPSMHDLFGASLTSSLEDTHVSHAGKRIGTDDPRHLWPDIERIIDECEPGHVFFENVEGHINLGLCEVLASLESRGYEATWGIFSAAEVGAPHQRKRVFILGRRKLADSGSEGLQRYAGNEQASRWKFPRKNRPATSGGLSLWPARPGGPQYEWEEPRIVADSAGGNEREAEPKLGGTANGTSSRVDRLRLLGNGVVPQVAEKAFITLMEELCGTIYS